MELVAYIDGIGLLGPGLTDWPAARAILAGEQAYIAAKTVIPAPELLPPAERRRASDIVKLSLATSVEALTAADQQSASLPSVFSFSNGDGFNCHSICETLASEERELSPTRFHNSVHNAVAGYWSIATKNMATSSVLCAFDASFSAGLLDAVTQVVVDNTGCILMTSDTPYPAPMHSKRPIPDNCGVAVVLMPQASARSLAKLHVRLSDASADTLSDPALESLRQHFPSARALPLLQAIARNQATTVALEYLDQRTLSVEINPC